MACLLSAMYLLKVTLHKDSKLSPASYYNKGNKKMSCSSRILSLHLALIQCCLLTFMKNISLYKMWHQSGKYFREILWRIILFSTVQKIRLSETISECHEEAIVTFLSGNEAEQQQLHHACHWTKSSAKPKKQTTN